MKFIKLITKYPVGSLALVSLVCGILWRLEIEYHGWAGLIWISYFHYSIPLGLIIFLIWGNQFLTLDKKRRFALNIVSIIYVVALYYWLGIALTYLFTGGPLGLMLWVQTPEWLHFLYRNSIFIIVPFIPIGTFLILRSFKHKAPLKFLVFSILGMIFSVPVSILFLDFTNHIGGANYIHTLKSGVIIPLWVFSIGLVVVGGRAGDARDSKSLRGA